MELLKTENLSIDFGGLRAVNNLNMEINEGELVGLIGPNGAGKTSVFNLLTGVYKPTEGSVKISGVNTFNLKTNKIVELGISRTFQNIRIYKQLSVLDNVRISLDQKENYSTLAAIFRTKKFRNMESELTKKALEYLRMFDLESMANNRADSLSYGNQRKLEIARALACNPKLLLLDEPAAGMNPNETQELMEIIRNIRDLSLIHI